MKDPMNNKELPTAIRTIYGDSKEVLEFQQKRYASLIQNFNQTFSSQEFSLFSTPGRVELGGNHTDHNNGRVLAASIDLDSIACATRNNQNVITVLSEGYNRPFVVDISDVTVVPEEAGTTESLIRGIAFKFRELSLNIGGFNAFITSNVMVGSGLSSSASIEVLIGTIVNGLFNENGISPVELAKIGKFAENRYFKKPCGLMDQIACAFGGIISIDFKTSESPLVTKIPFDFQGEEYSLLVVDTGGSHEDLTGEYAAVHEEMKGCAQFFGTTTLREVKKEEVLKNIRPLRASVGDRAVLRALHFFNDNELVAKQTEALKKNDFQRFLHYVAQSGNSSWKKLQNCFATDTPELQGIPLALSLTEEYLHERGAGAYRVHGGGFAGTMLCIMSKKHVTDYAKMMNALFGENAVTVLNIRSMGTTQIWPD